jgi:signal transduction histidine kinase/CheY-like chemotaxis protein
MGSVSPDLHPLLRQAWAQHTRDPARLLALGEEIVAAAAADTALAGWGWLHQAWGRRFRGEPEAAQHALAAAEERFAQAGSAAGLASCRDLQAMVLGLARRWDEALALLARNDTGPGSGRSGWERAQTHDRRAWIHNTQGRRDDALRERYGHLAAARDSDDAALTALSLGLLGGWHADLFNLDEAEHLCTEAVALARADAATQAWALSALNLLRALLGQGRAAEGLSLIDELEAAEAQLNQRAREQRCIIYAEVCTAAGLFARAQARLDHSAALRHAGSESLLSWTVAQITLWQAQGRTEAAHALGQAWLADPQHGTDPASAPLEQLRLLQAMSRLCETRGDPAAALLHQRRAFDVHEALVGRSARARRLALEIEHQLDLERRSRAQAEAERTRLDMLNRALEEASAAKTRFLAAASHDLRQPVQALALNMAALELESRQGGTPAQAELVGRMGASLQALSQMFDVLLDISRLDAGIVPVALQPLPLAPLLQRLADELADLAAARGLRLRLWLPAEAAGATTRTDPVLLERCLRNLLDNALKYTATGAVLLALRPRAGGWQVQVSDTGPGMSAAVLARACEEFFQADNPERDRRRGLGLGLSIVQRMLRLMGHEMALQSRPGHGTTAAVRLPRLAPAPSASRPGWVAAAPAAGGVVGVIDDDAEVRSSLAALLQRWGHAVLEGADAQALLAAWHAAGRPPVQAVITDLRLAARHTGIEAVQLLRQAWQQPVPALVITGDIAPDRLQALRASALPWLAKPVMPMRLRGWLAALAPPEGFNRGG